MQCSLSAVELSLNELNSRKLFAFAAAVVLSSNHGLDAAACYPRRLKTAYRGGEHCGAYVGCHHVDGRAVRIV